MKRQFRTNSSLSTPRHKPLPLSLQHFFALSISCLALASPSTSPFPLWEVIRSSGSELSRFRVLSRFLCPLREHAILGERYHLFPPFEGFGSLVRKVGEQWRFCLFLEKFLLPTTTKREPRGRDHFKYTEEMFVGSCLIVDAFPT